RRAERLPQIGASAAYVNARLPGSVNDGVQSALQGAAQALQQDGNPATVQALNGIGSNLDLDRTELYNVGFDASWEIDLFGRRRRAIEQAVAEAEASQAQLADAQVQLAAEVGQVYLNYRGLQARLAIADDNLGKARQSLALVRQRRERGAESDLQVERAATQVQQQEAQRLPLEAQAQEALDQLALMV
ncbi:TolC family protein, partial [Xanthomonas sp. Kuri4-2]